MSLAPSDHWLIVLLAYLTFLLLLIAISLWLFWRLHAKLAAQSATGTAVTPSQASGGDPVLTLALAPLYSDYVLPRWRLFGLAVFTQRLLDGIFVATVRDDAKAQIGLLLTSQLLFTIIVAYARPFSTPGENKVQTVRAAEQC